MREKHTIKIGGWLVAAVLAVFLPVRADAHPTTDLNRYPFVRIRTGRESANFDVRCITRDRDGFVWFGTSFGLLRYDGLLTVSAAAGPGSPLTGYINSVQEDAEGRLWVRVNDDHYVVYDRFTGRCRTDIDGLFEEMTGRPLQPSRIYIDEDKNFWILSPEGAGRIDRTGNWTSLPSELSSAEDPVRIVRSGEVCYLLYVSGTVDRIDPLSLQILKRSTPPGAENPAERHGFWQIFSDSRGDAWISDSYSGVWRYRADAEEWQHFSERNSTLKLSGDLVLDITEDGEGNIWIATDHGGINIYDPASGDITALEFDAYDHSSLASNSVYSLYCDTEQNIWAGHYKHGVSMFSPSRRNSFTRHVSRLLDNNRHDDINSICEDKAGNLWLGTNEFGVVRLNRTTGEETLFRGGTGPTDLGSDVVVCLFCDTRGRVWIGTYQGGLACWEDGRMRRYRHREEAPRSLADDSIWDIEEDADGNIWIGTMSGGLQRYVPGTDDFDAFTVRDGLLSDYVLDLACDRGRELYVSTVNGIAAINIRTLQCREIRTGDVTMHLCRDSRGLLWLVDRNGSLNVYDTNKGQFAELASGMMPSSVRSIVEGDDRSMWMSTDDGIYNVRAEADRTAGGYSFSVFGYHRQEEGRKTVYNFRSSARTARGEIIFGAVAGYIVTDPSDLCFDAKLAPSHPVRFSSLQVNGADIRPGTVHGGRKILEQDISFVRRIELGYRQNRFSLTFSPLDFSSPFNVEYLYKLEGFQEEWLPVNNERNEVDFTNLQPGRYRLRIRSSHSDGSVAEDAAALDVVIRPPFWQTSAARLLYVLLSILTALGLTLLLQHRQRRRLDERQARIEAEYQKRLNEMKINFFTNISHDFRTLLSLIISPLTELRTRAAGPDRNLFDVMHRNAQRLLHLVNQLLDYRKLEMHGMTLNRSRGNLVTFVQEICSSFELLTEESNLALAMELPEDWLECDFDKDKLEKILVNLLSNAFKYTREGSVTVMVTKEGDNAVIEVRDTGVGIPDADKERIFDRFYQVDRSDGGTGSGLGLHIVREFAVLHGGLVTVRDNEPQGSVFRVEIPLVRVETVETEGTEPADAPARDAEETPSGRSGRSVILLVEDNADFRHFVRDCFATDYDIREAEDGVAALEYLRHSPADIIISDIMMPRMDGLELCRRLKSDLATSHIPLILLTARSMQEQEIEGLSGGADDYIVKPVNISVLRLRIVRLLKWTRNSRERFSADPQIHPREITITTLDEQLIRHAQRLVMENIDNSDFSVEELSAQLRMHRTHLYKKLTFITGKSPLEFIRLLRLKRATELLTSDNRISVSEVAYMVGFNSPKVFARYFRETYGCSPREYQRGGYKPL